MTIHIPCYKVQYTNMNVSNLKKGKGVTVVPAKLRTNESTSFWSMSIEKRSAWRANVTWQRAARVRGTKVREKKVCPARVSVRRWACVWPSRGWLTSDMCNLTCDPGPCQPAMKPTVNPNVCMQAKRGHGQRHRSEIYFGVKIIQFTG